MVENGLFDISRHDLRGFTNIFGIRIRPLRQHKARTDLGIPLIHLLLRKSVRRKSRSIKNVFPLLSGNSLTGCQSSDRHVVGAAQVIPRP